MPVYIQDTEIDKSTNSDFIAQEMKTLWNERVLMDVNRINKKWKKTSESIIISFAKDKEQSNWQRHQNINNSEDSNLVEINASQEQSYQQEDDNLKNDRRKYQLRSTISLN